MPIDYVEVQPLKRAGLDASASISTPLKVERLKVATITITFRNNGSDESFYNVTFNGLLPSPAGLILFDASNQYITDLFSDEHGVLSRKSIQAPDWTIVKANEVVEAKEQFRVPDVKPGLYHLQLVYWLRLIAPVPPPIKQPRIHPHNEKEEQDFILELSKLMGEQDAFYSSRFWQRPLFRSNTILLEIK